MDKIVKPQVQNMLNYVNDIIAIVNYENQGVVNINTAVALKEIGLMLQELYNSVDVPIEKIDENFE